MVKNRSSIRQNWGGDFPDTLKPNDLTSVQRESYQRFLNSGIKDSINEISPVEDFTGKNWILEFEQHSFDPPKYSYKDAIEKGVTYDAPLKLIATLTSKQTGKKLTQEVFFGDIPQMTNNGTFVINGVERCIVNQIVRSPGVFFSGEVDRITGRMLYNAEIRPEHGSWLDFGISRNDILTIRIDRKRKFPVTTFLRAIGIDDNQQILEVFKNADTDQKHKYISSTLEKDTTKNSVEAILEIYRRMRPGEPVVLETAREYLKNLFFNSRRYSLDKVGRYKMNKKLGLNIPNDRDHWMLTKDDIIATIAYLIKLQNNLGDVDDIDHLGNRRVRTVGELVATNAFRVGLLRLERVIKERMSLVGSDIEITPSLLVNARPVIAAINDFFRTSQLSAILDQNNPLSELDNLRRLTVMGTGGISRERASFSIRDINASQYGRICPVRSPEGPNIGLVTYMALYTRVNEYGFLETPYRKVLKEKKGAKIRVKVTDDIEYLSADDEQSFYISHALVSLDENKYIINTHLPVRYKGNFFEEETGKIDYVDIIPRQVVGLAASLIPFLSNDEANRALMGTHMQCQAVPLLNPASPIVGTGMEQIIPLAMERVIRTDTPGKINYVDANRVEIKLKNGKTKDYQVKKFVRTAQSTCFSQKPLVNKGDNVIAGQVIIDGPAAQDGELALGQNLLIAYMSYEGLGYEDAIVISDRLVKEDVLTSINIEEYEASVVDTKLGSEETTRDIPNVGEEALANLDKDGIVVIGADVKPNDILIGKIAPKGETELTAEERLLRAIFGEKAREVRDTSMRMPHGERGVVIDIKILDRDKGDELEPGTIRKIIVKVAQIRKVVVGDKLAGRHGNKGVISKIVATADMPYLADGTPVDIIISPLSVLSRMNLGQLLEAHLGIAASKLGYKVAVPVFEKVSEDKIVGELKKAGLPVDGKMVLYDGKTGEPYNERVVIGIEYIMKLIHMVEDKTHARSTGPYSLVTQQPLGGKAQMGGQRLGEMEVWALEAHKAARILQEMLTIKSDDVIGRARSFEAIVKGGVIPESTVPESFKVLIKELQALKLSIIPTGVITRSEVAPAVKEEIKEDIKDIKVTDEKLVENDKTVKLI